MTIELKIPEVGESIREVQVSQWLKLEGDTVAKDEPVVVIESDKATVELPAPEAGRLSRILSPPGQTVAVGAAIAQIETDGNGGESQPAKPPPAEKAKPKPAAPSQAEPTAPAGAPAPRVPVAPASERKPPAAAPQPETKAVTQPEPPPAKEPAEAAESPRAAAAPTPTAPKAQPAPSSQPKPSSQPAQRKAVGAREEEVIPMSMLRRTVARRLVEAQQTMAMLTTFNEVDMGAVQSLRHEHQEGFQQRYDIKLGLMSFFVKAAIAAIKEFPQLNAQVRGDDVVYRNYFDIGVAIAGPRGLVVPVLVNAERLSFAEVETAIADFARRAKDAQLKPEELEGGTFTITNGGVFGSLLSTPIINPPQAGILGLHAIADRPVAREGSVVIRPMMYVALTYDHRIVDGREAVLFLRRIKDLIEAPSRMLLEV
jgi:2-oxoglutarate dehydrogenase E2 component (dihydrolipoamide succinyltransferase)